MIKDEWREEIHRIFEHYGTEKQITKTYEEIGEFLSALAKGDVSNIAEEMADVLICMEHVAYAYDIMPDEIETIIRYKIKRQKKRMEENV